MRTRHEFRFGTRQVVLIGLASLVIWGLTFVLGVLVGRETRRASAPGSATAGVGSTEKTRRPAKVERASTEERLTFYETLTAPTPTVPVVRPPTVEEKIVPAEPPREPAVRAPERVAPRPPPETPPPRAKSARPAVTKSEPLPPSPPALAPQTPAPAAEASLWTVQVSSFRSRTLAEELRAKLAVRGFDAYLVSMTTEDGRVRHRVRVGGFVAKGDAEQVATELRNEPNLNPFVTSRGR